MKLMVLAGGLGAGLSEETDARPKLVVEIGGCLTSPSSLFRLSAPPIVDEVLVVGMQA